MSIRGSSRVAFGAGMGIVIALALNGLFVAAEWWAVSQWGSVVGLWLVTPLIFPLAFPLAFALLGVSTAAIALGIFKAPARAAGIVSAVAAYLIVFPSFEGLAGRIRMLAFERLAVRSDPLVEAVRAFTSSRRRPPRNLEELVPRYISIVPSTGMAAYPTYDYVVGKKARKEFGGNEWALLVNTPSGPLGWDCFVYFPNQDYPEEGLGGNLQRIRNWAYVHE